jgi:hypothetical protein
MKKTLRNQLSGIAVLTLALVAGCGRSPEAGNAALPSVRSAPDVINVTDADVTIKVKTALQQDAALSGFDIGVITLKGDVRLTGLVDNQGQIDSALKLARAADGVHSLHNELSLKK